MTMMKKASKEQMMTRFDCGRGVLTPHRMMVGSAALSRPFAYRSVGSTDPTERNGICRARRPRRAALGCWTFATALLATSLPLYAQTGIYVNSGNNVGIGTTSPDLKLQANVGTAATYGLGVYNTNDNLKLLFGTTTGSYLNIQGKTINTNAPYNIALQAEGGNVGIGTTNPDIAGWGSNTTVLTVKGPNSSNSGGILELAAHSANVSAGNYVGVIDFVADANASKEIAAINAVLSGSTTGNLGSALKFYTKSDGGSEAERMRIDSNGNLGLGTTSPGATLHVLSTLNRVLNIDSSAPHGPYLAFKRSGMDEFYIGENSAVSGIGPASLDLYANSGYGIKLFANGDTSAVLALGTSGNVGIGTTSPQYKLDVTGQVHASSFVSSTTTYADFVFKPDYKLAPLSDVETAIKKDGHLPGIPSEAEATAHGIDLASMQVKLLQKIEELTLHQIEQQKLLEGQNKRIDEQSKRIEQLEKENTELRAQR